MKKQFSRKKVSVQRLIGVDGRCKNEGYRSCRDKLETFELMYDVKIKSRKKNRKPLKELVPASSLTIGTISILREQVRRRWTSVLIFEDDVELVKGFRKKFEAGIRQLPKTWDILYLGCGNDCGVVGISEEKSARSPHLSTLSALYDEEVYAFHPNDIRNIPDKSEQYSDHLSIPYQPGGTWAYAYSLKGARKVLDAFSRTGKNAGIHIDQFIMRLIRQKKLEVYAFDPPIVMHEKGMIRSDTDIPWN